MNAVKLLSALLFAGLIVTSSASAAVNDGAVLLDSSDLRRKNGVVCGRLNDDEGFIPGSFVKGTLFLSYSQRIANLQAMLGGKNKKRKADIRKSLRGIRKKLANQAAACTEAGSPSVMFKAMNGAVGIAVQDPNGTQAASGSNVFMVASDGSLQQWVINGQVSVSRVFIAKGRIFVLFRDRINLDTGLFDWTTGCLLATVSPETGAPTCVDNEISQVMWQSFGTNTRRNPPIQFDDEGRIYYLGYTSAGTMVLRRYTPATSTTESLITDNVYMYDFLVQGNATVFLTGQTMTTNISWVRKLEGGLVAVDNEVSSFLAEFPDGNVYYGVTGSNQQGVYRYLTAEDRLDEQQWIGSWYEGYSDGPAPHFNVAGAPMCIWGEDDYESAFCGSTGAWVVGLAQNSVLSEERKVLAITGYSSERSLMQYYPSVERVNSNVTNPTLVQSLLDRFFVAGTNDALENLLVMLNPDGSETLIVDGIEVYRVGIAGSKLVFDGLLFATNQYVIGSYDLQTGEVAYAPTGTSKLIDLELMTM